VFHYGARPPEEVHHAFQVERHPPGWNVVTEFGP
jgi:hypothetical protein